MLSWHNEILYINDKKFSWAICNNMNESHTHNFEGEGKPNINSINFVIPFMWSRKTGETIKVSEALPLGKEWLKEIAVS